jgi:hypothetical protein
MNTETYSMLAPAAVSRSRAQVSMWAVPVQGIRMQFPVPQLRSISGVSNGTCTATANAAQGATNGATKDAQGDEAFEDPV